MNRIPDQPTPVHRFSSANDIQFRLVAIDETKFETPDIAHRHNYWTVFIFLKGTGRHLIDFCELKTEPGNIHFVLPGQVHALNGEKNFLAYAFIFTEEYFMLREETRKLLMRLFGFMDASKPAVLTIPQAETDSFNRLLEIMKIEYSRTHELKSLVMLDLLSVFINKCMALMRLPAQQHEPLPYLQFREAVEKNFRTVHTVAEYCKLLNTHPKALNTLSKTFSDMNALEFIHNRLVMEAKRLLLYSNKPIKQIAYELHFTDAAHFTKFLKQKTGLTPLELKNGQ